MSASILIVEDETKLAELLRDYLQRDGYRCRLVHDGALVVPAIRVEAPDLILLDLMLPNQDGMSLCREIRGFSTVPIIMLTARVEEIDRLLGLEIGADDYVCKPYSPREVVARVRALLRRSSGFSEHAPAQVAITLDSERQQARFGKQIITLTPVEFRLLALLVQANGRVLSRNQLLDGIYLDHRVVTDRTVDSHIKNLRRKLTDTTGTDPIHSVYGVGYRYEVG